MADNKSKQKYNLRDRNKNKLSKTRHDSTDDEESESQYSDSDYTDVEDYDPNDSTIMEEIMDEEEFQKFIYQLFPSEYQKKKVKHSKSMKSKIPKPKKVIEEEEIIDEEFDEDTNLLEDENGNINITFTISNLNNINELLINSNDEYIEEDSDDEDSDDEDDDVEDEDEDEDQDDDDNKLEKDLQQKKTKNSTDIEGCKIKTKYSDDATTMNKVTKTKKGKKINSKSKESKEQYIEKEQEILSEIEKATASFLAKIEDSELLNELKEFTRKKQKELKKQQKKSEKKEKRQNTEQFKKLLNEKKAINELNYFYSLPIEKQQIMIKSMKELNTVQQISVPYRFKLLEMNLPDSIKDQAMRKVNVLRTMDPSTGEYNKIKTWIDAFMTIPFNTHKKLNISINDGNEKCQSYISNAMKILNGCVYGLDDAKMQIIQMIGTWIANPDAIGNAIAIKGPPGTGKTTLVKEGISKILERPFEFIALGGSTDSSFLEGHSYTYEGSTWGKIASILMKSKCMNPIIYFDELDKVSETPKGEEIIGVLTHLIDTSQNSQFHDKYFADIDFDLSKCLFIFSYNDENKVNPILKDRMYKIETKGYDTPEKKVITKDYLLPTIHSMINFKPEDITLSDEVIEYIISTYTESEKGVRNLKRCLEILHTKLNLYRLTNGSIDENIQKNMKLENVSFPYTVTRECIEKLIKPKEVNPALMSLYT